MGLPSKNKRFTCARCGGHEVRIEKQGERNTARVRCAKCKREMSRNYQKRNPSQCSSKRSAYKANHQIEIMVRNFSNKLEQRGVLGNSGSCLFCGSNEHLEKHHLNPIDPFSVIRLCRKCHKQLHSHFTPYFINRNGVMEYELSGLQYRYVVRWDQTLQTNDVQNLLL
jgi:hypothetical protein